VKQTEAEFIAARALTDNDRDHRSVSRLADSLRKPDGQKYSEESIKKVVDLSRLQAWAKYPVSGRPVKPQSKLERPLVLAMLEALK
jgi:hypothetical protein